MDRSKQMELSIWLQTLASLIDQALTQSAGEPLAFVLIVDTDGVVQYVSNADRQDGITMVEGLLERWKAGRADIPAHYNPDLAAPGHIGPQDC